MALTGVKIFILFLGLNFLDLSVATRNEQTEKVKRELDIRKHLEHVTDTMDGIALSIAEMKVKDETEGRRLDSVIEDGKIMWKSIDTLSQSLSKLADTTAQSLKSLEERLKEEDSLIKLQIVAIDETQLKLEEKLVQLIETKQSQTVEALTAAIQEILQANARRDVELEAIRSEIVTKASDERVKEDRLDFVKSISEMKLAQDELEANFNAKISQADASALAHIQQERAEALQNYDAINQTLSKLDEIVQEQKKDCNAAFENTMELVTSLNSDFRNKSLQFSSSVAALQAALLETQETARQDIFDVNATMNSVAVQLSNETIQQILDLHHNLNLSQHLDSQLLTNQLSLETSLLSLNDGFMEDRSFDLTTFKIPTIMLPKLLSPGNQVVRGKDWAWGDQDGLPPSMGTVVDHASCEGWIVVQWANGTIGTYRNGVDRKYDLQLSRLQSPVNFVLKLLTHQHGAFHESQVRFSNVGPAESSPGQSLSHLILFGVLPTNDKKNVEIQHERIDFTNCLKTGRCCKDLCLLEYESRRIYPIDGCVTGYVDKNCEGESRNYFEGIDPNLGDWRGRIKSVSPCTS